MATLTIRNLSVRVMHGLAALARQRNTSMEQEAQRLLEDYLTERASVEKQIEASWSSQLRRPSAVEIDSWITAGRV